MLILRKKLILRKQNKSLKIELDKLKPKVIPLFEGSDFWLFLFYEVVVIT